MAKQDLHVQKRMTGYFIAFCAGLLFLILTAIWAYQLPKGKLSRLCELSGLTACYYVPFFTGLLFARQTGKKGWLMASLPLLCAYIINLLLCIPLVFQEETNGWDWAFILLPGIAFTHFIWLVFLVCRCGQTQTRIITWGVLLAMVTTFMLFSVVGNYSGALALMFWAISIILGITLVGLLLFLEDSGRDTNLSVDPNLVKDSE